MKIQRILCPIDFSEFNRTANLYASMLAKATGAEIIYLHAFLPAPYETPPAHFDHKQLETDIKVELKEFIQPTEESIKYSHVVENGFATHCIVDFAKEFEVDLIVMSTHGRTGLSRVLMGSIAEAVIRQADCPVLALKADAKIATMS